MCMNRRRSQCHESPFPYGLRHRPVMLSPSSSALAPQARGEACSSRQPAVAASHEPISFKSSRYPPLFPEDRQKPLRENASSRCIRRRASQGSLPTKPSAVSRFLSKKNVCVQIPDAGHLVSSDSPPRPQGDYFSVLPPTPPDDDEHLAWNHRPGMSYFGAHVSRSPASEPCPVDQGPSIASAVAPDNVGSPGALSNPSSVGGSQSSNGDAMDCDRDSWLENGIEAVGRWSCPAVDGVTLTLLVSSLDISNGHGEPVKIVAQTLPYPHTEDKPVALPVRNIFGSVVQSVQNRPQQGQSPYIHITHAVPEQFSLSNLPSSPPSTPNCQIPRDDYFNANVFSSAAVVSAYHDFRGLAQTQLSHSPMPVVPPYSVHISVLERYLPPPSPQEYLDLFFPHRPSFLVDRLFELSPDGGSLLFIYPTKRGAYTFKSQYLGPILDPLLRQLVVVNELSADIGRHLGKFSSVSQMDDFDVMKSKISQLCHALSSPKSQFSLVDGGRGSVHFDRHQWTEWYIHQERGRMKEVLSAYWRNGRRIPLAKAAFDPRNHSLADKEVTSAMLLAEILDGIRRRPYESQPRDGVELGVFVIRRSR